MNTKEFVEKLKQDAESNNLEILEKIKSAGNDPEAIYAVAVEFGVTDSFDIFKAEITDAFGTSEALSEEALKNVTGGALTIQIYEEAIRKAFG